LGAVDDVVTTVADRPGADGRHVAAAARLGDRDGGQCVTPADGRQVLLLQGLAARPVEMGRGHVAVHADGHGEGAGARARALLVQHRRGQHVGARPAVLLVVLHPQQPQRAHARPDPARHPPRRLPLLDVRRDLLLDKAPHRAPEHLVLLVEDFHRPLPSIPLFFLCSRFLWLPAPHPPPPPPPPPPPLLPRAPPPPPSAFRGSASVN